MTEFETALLGKLDNIAEVFSIALDALSEEQKIINKYNLKIQLNILLESEHLTATEKAALQNELNSLST